MCIDNDNARFHKALVHGLQTSSSMFVMNLEQHRPLRVSFFRAIRVLGDLISLPLARSRCSFSSKLIQCVDCTWLVIPLEFQVAGAYESREMIGVYC